VDKTVKHWRDKCQITRPLWWPDTFKGKTWKEDTEREVQHTCLYYLAAQTFLNMWIDFQHLKIGKRPGIIRLPGCAGGLAPRSCVVEIQWVRPGHHKILYLPQIRPESLPFSPVFKREGLLGMVEHTCNLSTRKAKEGGWWVQGQSRLHNKI
jgi:hypothetical protein